jgi:hypothetical protein
VLLDTVIFPASTEAMERRTAGKHLRPDSVVIAILPAVLGKTTKKLLNMVGNLLNLQSFRNKR